MKLLILIILILFEKGFAHDNCLSAATLNVIETTLSNGLQFGLTNPLAILGSIFNLESASTCELDSKLNTILSKLIETSQSIKNLENLLKCEHSDVKKILFELRVKMTHMLNSINQFYKSENKDKNVIAQLCTDNSEGISKIYTLFTSLLDEDNVVYYFKNCANFESDYIQMWKKELVKIRTLLLFLLKGCEDAYYLSEFIGYLFVDKTNELINYYTENLLLNEFHKNMNEIIKPILNQGKSAVETGSILQKKYNFFKWSVIFYSSSVQGWDYHTAYYDPNSVYCGSTFFLRELEHSRNALVAWCLSDALDNTHINLPRLPLDSARVLNEQFSTINPRNNFVLVVHYHREGFKPDAFGEFKSRSVIYIESVPCVTYFVFHCTETKGVVYAFASGMKSSIAIVKYKKEKIFDSAIWFSKQSGFKKYENIRMDRYYREISVKSPFSCLKLCVNDSECSAATVRLDNDATKCFLGRSTSIFYKDSNWITFSKNDIKVEKKIYHDMIMFEEYKQIARVNSEDECIEYCLSETKCIGFILHDGYTCKLFDHNLKYLKKKNYKSYILIQYLELMSNLEIDQSDKVDLNYKQYIKSKNVENPIIRKDIRLFNHFKLINSKSHESCWNDCLKEDSCIASLFAWGLCFFYDYTFSFMKENGFKTFSRNLKSVQNRLNDQNNLNYHVIESKFTTNWGQWGNMELCENRNYVYGFQTRVERHLGKEGDDTSMNAIRLFCRNSDEIHSLQNIWGDWGKSAYCPSNGRVKGFAINVEPPQGSEKDDTATNSIRLICEDNTVLESDEYNFGNWWSDWILCPQDTFIIGVQTQVEESLGKGDDTALNNIRFACSARDE